MVKHDQATNLKGVPFIFRQSHHVAVRSSIDWPSEVLLAALLCLPGAMLRQRKHQFWRGQWPI